MTAQLDTDGRLRHLLSLDGLPRVVLERVLDRAQALAAPGQDAAGLRRTLAGKAVCTLFFDPSTRTRTSFQLAAARLGADTVNFDASTSSAKKGETDADTLRTIEAMGVQGFVVRHPVRGEISGFLAHLLQARVARTAIP